MIWGRYKVYENNYRTGCCAPVTRFYRRQSALDSAARWNRAIEAVTSIPSFRFFVVDTKTWQVIGL